MYICECDTHLQQITSVFGVSVFPCLYVYSMFFHTVSTGNLNVLCLCVCSVLSVHEGLMVSDGLTIKRLSLWRV